MISHADKVPGIYMEDKENSAQIVRLPMEFSFKVKDMVCVNCNTTIEKSLAQTLCEQPPHGRFARAHQANEINVARDPRNVLIGAHAGL